MNKIYAIVQGYLDDMESIVGYTTSREEAESFVNGYNSHLSQNDFKNKMWFNEIGELKESSSYKWYKGEKR